MENKEKIWNRRFILLFITNLLVLAAFYASIPIIPIYCQEIGITGSKVGIVLTAMSVATILFRPVAGYLLDNFNRYRVYLLFLALFCLSFPAFIAFPIFGALIIGRLYMGAVYSVCGSATMTLAGDVLPPKKITAGISRFAFTVSIGREFVHFSYPFSSRDGRDDCDGVLHTTKITVTTVTIVTLSPKQESA